MKKVLSVLSACVMLISCGNGDKEKGRLEKEALSTSNDFKYQTVQMKYNTTQRLIDSPYEQVCPPIQSVNQVVVFLGQSQLANHAEGLRGDENKDNELGVFEYDNKCYKAQDPVVGASINGDLMRQQSYTVSVIKQLNKREGLVAVGSNLALAGSGAEDWVMNVGAWRQQLMALSQRYRWAKKIVVWQQGETDLQAQSSEESYYFNVAGVLNEIKAMGFEILVIRSTRCALNFNENNPIARAQIRLQKQYGGLINSDLITDTKRYDNCHYKSSAQKEMSQALVSEIMSIP